MTPLLAPMHHLSRHAAVFGILALALAPAAGAATVLFPQSAFTFSSGPITPEDIEIVKRSSAPLFEAPIPGIAAKWENPNSGNQGAVRIVKIYEMKKLSCRTFEYTTKFPARAQPSKRYLDWCEMSKGEWKLVDPVEMRGG